MDIARFIISLFSFFGRLFVDKRFSTEAVWIMRVRVLLTMVYTELNELSLRESSMITILARGSIPFFSTTRPSSRPQTYLASKIILARMMQTISISVFIR